MDVEELLRGIKPLEGQVTAIRTVQETRPREDYGAPCLKSPTMTLHASNNTPQPTPTSRKSTSNVPPK